MNTYKYHKGITNALKKLTFQLLDPQRVTVNREAQKRGCYNYWFLKYVTH